MQPRDFTAERQSQPRAARAPGSRLIGLIKRFKRPRDLFFRHKLCLSFAMARW